MCQITRNYTGNGNFIVGSKEYSANFSLVQYSNSNIIIEWEVSDLINIEPGAKVAMEGIVTDPEGKIDAPYSHVNKVSLGSGTKIISMKSFRPVEITYLEQEYEKLHVRIGLTNFVFRDCEQISSEENGFSAEIDDFNVFLIQLDDYTEKVKLLENKIEKKLITSELVLSFNYDDMIKVQSLIWNICYLLSYACRNVISPVYEDYFTDEYHLKTILRPVLTRDFHNRDPLIDSDHFHNCTLKDFLETVYSNYVEYKNKFGLNIVFSFYLEAVTFPYMDMGFLLNSTALETLLSGYEVLREEEGNPINKGIIKKNKKEIFKILKENDIELEEVAEEIANKISYPNLNIQEKLSAFIKDDRFELELKQYDRDFSFIRNKITHTGKFPITIKSDGRDREINRLEEHNRLIYLSDRIILKILGYTGPFLNRGNDYSEEYL